jgi:hypothetical protein
VKRTRIQRVQLHAETGSLDRRSECNWEENAHDGVLAAPILERKFDTTTHFHSRICRPRWCRIHAYAEKSEVQGPLALWRTAAIFKQQLTSIIVLSLTSVRLASPKHGPSTYFIALSIVALPGR